MLARSLIHHFTSINPWNTNPHNRCDTLSCRRFAANRLEAEDPQVLALVRHAVLIDTDVHISSVILIGTSGFTGNVNYTHCRSSYFKLSLVSLTIRLGPLPMCLAVREASSESRLVRGTLTESLYELLTAWSAPKQ